MRLIGPWATDPLWATAYDWLVEHENVGGLLWRLGTDSPLADLYAATDEIGRLPAGSRVLDVPCGGGVALRGLKRGQGIDYVAADIAPAMLDRTVAAAAERGVLDQVRPRVEDLHALSFDDDSFDLVVSLTGLHVVPDPVTAVRELARVLRPGGRLTGSALLTDTGLRFEGLRLALDAEAARRAVGGRSDASARRDVRCVRLFPGGQSLSGFRWLRRSR
jgi:SAM-dependent methyltransferase